MTKLFDDLMTGLDEVGAFLAGKTAGCKVNSSAESDLRNVEAQPVEEAATTIREKLRPQRH
jgi:hypothetical protein